MKIGPFAIIRDQFTSRQDGCRIGKRELPDAIAGTGLLITGLLVTGLLVTGRVGATSGLRIGIGHDTHRLEQGGPLRLGGCDIPHSHQLVGHSDADVLLHAVTDALLGAAALGDIGRLFPDTDASNRGRDSAEMLAIAAQQVNEAGWGVVNLDCIVFAQRPKLAPFADAIRERLAEILQLQPGQIGFKAKTGERVGPIGKEEAMAAQCIVLLQAPAAAI